MEDLNYPTPILDEIANRMAAYLADGKVMTVTDLAQAIEANRRTVYNILHRPCDRHGNRFEVAGEVKTHRVWPTKLYRIKVNTTS